MKKDVLISLKSTQTDGVDTDSIEFITEGRYYKKGSNYYITYKETELTGMEGSTILLKIEKSKFSMTRYGDNNTHMVFEKGQSHLTCYETPYGSMSVNVHSNNVDVNLSDAGGFISADYNIEVNNGSDIMKNTLELEIKSN